MIQTPLKRSTSASIERMECRDSRMEVGRVQVREGGSLNWGWLKGRR